MWNQINSAIKHTFEVTINGRRRDDESDVGRYKKAFRFLEERVGGTNRTFLAAASHGLITPSLVPKKTLKLSTFLNKRGLYSHFT
ncbi:hypothetical protein F2Q70_00016468 [Brassica cretica]|uniref:Uncharacterized protein n=1 Tax=Brassica cretica TaxID=69181 RepID=A0A8S9KVC2_BRACR|nr:hypothetical protein F2Q70_00016468 [Brassica cretica]KAF2599510.1 hypothetical protein F2Q68_00009432 [Brassica cretica]